MSKRRRKAPPKITREQLRDCAMLMLTPAQAAADLGITIDELEALLEKPAHRAAWEDGQAKITKHVNRKIIAAVNAGNASAMRFAHQLIERSTAGGAEDDADEAAPAQRPARPTNDTGTADVLASFRDIMQGGGAAG